MTTEQVKALLQQKNIYLYYAEPDSEAMRFETKTELVIKGDWQTEDSSLPVDMAIANELVETRYVRPHRHNPHAYSPRN